MAILWQRQGSGADYTIFSESTAAIERVLAGRPGPGQALAKAVIEFERLLIESKCTATIRWTPAHKGVGGNEITDSYAKCSTVFHSRALAGGTKNYAKWAVEGYTDRVGPEYLRGKSRLSLQEDNGGPVPAHQGMGRRHVKAERRYRPLRGGKNPRKEGKGVASRFFQLLSGRARSAPTCLKKPKRSDPTNAGGVVAASDSRAITSLSNAEPGLPRSRSCGGASGRPASGSTRERRPSDCSPKMNERPHPSRPSCGIQRSGGWWLWRLLRMMSGRGWES